MKIRRVCDRKNAHVNFGSVNVGRFKVREKGLLCCRTVAVRPLGILEQSHENKPTFL